MKPFLFIILVIFAIISLSACKETVDKATYDELSIKTDSFELVIENQAKLIDSLSTQLDVFVNELDSLLATKQIESKPKLAIPMFIGKSMKYIKDFWATKISNEYFGEGVYSDTKESYFRIMVESVGQPDFVAIFGSDGLCTEHTTKIGHSDITIMQARLMKAGYKHSTSCKCWKLSGANHLWTITDSPGTGFELTCRRK